MSDLVERVLGVVRQIPPGRVLTYGDVAAMVTAPTPRDVGQVLLHHGDDVPWWRVLRADGTPPEHLRDRQLALLRSEGTPMAAFGQGVDLRHARWEAAGHSDGQQGSLFD